MPIQTPSLAMAWLSDYLHAENAAGPSEAGMRHSSSVGDVCPTGHNSDSSQVQFDGGARYFGDVELAESIDEEESATAVPNLLPCGMEIYVLDKPSLDDDEDLFSSSEVGGDPSVSLYC